MSPLEVGHKLDVHGDMPGNFVVGIGVVKAGKTGPYVSTEMFPQGCDIGVFTYIGYRPLKMFLNVSVGFLDGASTGRSQCFTVMRELCF